MKTAATILLIQLFVIACGCSAAAPGSGPGLHPAGQQQLLAYLI